MKINKRCAMVGTYRKPVERNYKEYRRVINPSLTATYHIDRIALIALIILTLIVGIML